MGGLLEQRSPSHPLPQQHGGAPTNAGGAALMKMQVHPAADGGGSVITVKRIRGAVLPHLQQFARMKAQVEQAAANRSNVAVALVAVESSSGGASLPGDGAAGADRRCGSSGKRLLPGGGDSMATNEEEPEPPASCMGAFPYYP